MTAPRHVVVVGAARSGTKLVRDALTEVTGVGAVPYDIGYVWRHGNEEHPDDAIDPKNVTPRSRRFIQRFVDRYALGDPPVVIEKTVGNSMRVPVVASTFPDAVFVHLIRDGVDVAESTRRQWYAKPDMRYLMQKARHFPASLAPRYGARYAVSLAHRLIGSDRRVGTWGPRYPGIDRDLDDCQLLTVCARQWSQSVSRVEADLQRLASPVVKVRYEDFVQDSSAELTRIAEACGLQAPPDLTHAVSRTVSPARSGAGRSVLSHYERMVLDDEIGGLLTSLSYDRPTSRVPEEPQ